MNNILIRFRFDKAQKATNAKQGLLQVEVREKGFNKCILISTGIKLYKNQFSDKMGFTCRNHTLAEAITKQAHNIFNEIHTYALSDKCITLQDAKGYKDSSSKELIIPFIESEMRVRNMEYNTMKAHRTLVNKLKEFKQIKIFSDLTYTNITAFDNYMRGKGIGNMSINKNHSLFNMYIKIAINKELLDKSPYNTFTPSKAKNNDPVFLTHEEIMRIKNVENLTERLERVRDLFIFQCFTGMAYVDMQAFSKDDIQTIDGKDIIKSSRTKTDESFILLFLPYAKEIAEKYDYKLPKISNQKYNDYLKIIVAHDKVNINKNVTSHTGRHRKIYYRLLIN